MKNSKFRQYFFSSGNWVTMYAIFYMILTVVYCLPRFLCQVSNIDMTRVSNGFTIPLSIFAWGLTAICSGYCGMDRAASAVKSAKMEVGSCDMGDPSKVRHVIYLLVAIFAESVLFNFLFGTDISTTISVWNPIIKDYEDVARNYKGIKIPLEGVSTALVSAISLYIIGNKAVRITSSVNNSKDNESSSCEEIVVINKKDSIISDNSEDIALV